MPKTAYAGVAAGVVFTAFLVWILGGWSQGDTLRAIDDIVLTVLAVAAALSAGLTARSAHRRLRAPWTALCLGFTAFALGEVIWTVYEFTGHETPFPSLADVAFLLFPVGACAGLLLLAAEHNTGSRGRVFLDGVIVAGSLFLISWVTILAPLYNAPETDRLAFIVSFAYPVTDLLILTLSAVVLVQAGPEQRLVLTLLTLGLTCIALADSGFAYLSAKGQYSSGNSVDIGWIAGLLLVTVAATAGREASGTEGGSALLPGWASIWLPYAPLLLAGIVVAANPPGVLQSGLVETVGGVLVVAVLARQFLAVNENRRLLETVSRQALRDPLTGLANRALFNERLDHAMELRARDGAAAVGVVAVDLNDFKMVNDSLGHPVGDDLLVGVASRLLNCVRPGDTVARLGGDEFAVVVEGSPDASHLIAHRVVEAFELPFRSDGHQLLMHPSVGLAIAEPGETGLSAEELFRRADLAMYAAKRTRIRGVQTYNPEMQLAPDLAEAELFGRSPATVTAGGVAAIELLGELRQAIADSELTLDYQPKVDLLTSRIVGVEALVRWPRANGEVLAPDDFLPLVRRHGLMAAVTDFVLNRALDDALAWRAASFDVPVAVNLFAPSLANLGIPSKISRALAERDLNPATLTVEITEDMFLDNLDRPRTVLEQLRRTGVRIAIDDFGSGYSALSYLRELPIDEVKLDRYFIAPMLVDPRAATVVRAVIGLAAGLGLVAVAEGIENAETADWLREHGCPIGQGHYLSPPVPFEQLMTLLAENSPSGSLRRP